MLKKAIIFQLAVWGFFDATAQQLVLNTGHSDVVNCVKISKDEKYAFSASNDKTIKMWDISTGKEIKTFTGHTFAVKTIDISPDGKYILSGSGRFIGSEMKLWDISTGKEIRNFIGHRGTVLSVAFSPDGNFALSASDDKSVKFWDINKETYVKNLEGHDGWVFSVAFNADGTKAVSCAIDGNTLILWNIESGKRIKSFKENTTRSIAVDMSPNGEYIISGNILYTAKTGKLLASINDIPVDINDVCFNASGEKILFGAEDNSIILWDMNSKQVVRKFLGHHAGVTSVDFGKNGKIVLSGSKDKELKLWDLETGKEIRTFTGSKISYETYGLAGNHILKNAKITESETVSFIRNFSGDNWIASCPDNKTIAIATFDKKIQITDIQSKKLLKEHNLPAECVKYSPDNKYLATGEYKTIQIWDVASNTLLKNLTAHSSFVPSMDFSPDSKYLASGSYDSFIKIWDINSGLEIKTLKGHTSSVLSVAYSYDGKKILSGSVDETLKIWDVASGNEIKTFTGHTMNVRAVAISNDGKYAASGSDENIIKLWEIESGKELKTLAGHSNSILKVLFSPDDKYILSCSKGGYHKLWDFKTGLCLLTYWSNDANNWVAYTPDGRFDGSMAGIKMFHFVKELSVIPLESLYEQYYTPNLLSQVIGVNVSTSPVMDITQLKPAPEVKIISPENNKTVNQEQIKITIKTTDQGGGIDEIRLYHNGKLFDGTTRGFKSTGQNHEFTVMLTNGENRIKATAFNSQRTESIPDEIVVHYKAPEIVKPNMHILAVGINSYLNPKYNLNYAKNDADAFVKSLSAGASSLFGKVEVTTINDADATKTGILAAVEKIKSASKAEDVFVFYYAGHGVMSSGTGVEKPLFYLVPHDVTKMYEADEMLKKSGISATEIGEFSKTIKAQKQLFVIDACQSGGAIQTLAMRGAAEEKAIAQLARSTGTYFIAASGTEQFATEVAELGHGIFTYSVIEALKGSCKSQDGKITVNLLKSCVEDLVPELSKKHKGQPQFPTGYGFGMDFPVVMVK